MVAGEPEVGVDRLTGIARIPDDEPADYIHAVAMQDLNGPGRGIANRAPGLALRQLEPLTELLVQTRNTRYRIVVSRDADIVIQGGAFFPDPTRAHVEGSSLGGNLLKVGWIGIGSTFGSRPR